MLLSAVSVLVVAQSSPENPEGLMNNPVIVNKLHKGEHNYHNNIGLKMCEIAT